MAYRIEKTPNGGQDLVISGFDKGISDSPYQGISDMRNMNVISVPDEAMVNFSTSTVTYTVATASVLSADAGADTVTVGSVTGTLANGMAVTFSGASLPSGITAGTVYWIYGLSGTTFQLQVTAVAGTGGLVNIGGTGTGSMASVNMGQPKWWTIDTVNTTYYIVDANGRVWTDYYVANNVGGNARLWKFTGNTTLTNASGDGIIAWKSYLFVFRNFLIDYMPLPTVGNEPSFSWTYGWQSMSSFVGGTHNALVGQDDVVYFCNNSAVGSLMTTIGSSFDPATASTYLYNQSALALPTTDYAKSLTELGINLMVGGKNNLIYPWDRISTSFRYPIFLPENNVQRMVTVNTNTFIFPGVRGRIYITNGSQAQLYKKLPDHLSGTQDPLYTWGATGFHKNQLYFGASVTDSAGSAITAYGGLWAIDMDTQAMRLVNKLSYDTYLGFASVFIPINGSNIGTGFYAGWDSGASTYGMDKSSNNPYSNDEAYVDSDMIPVGTFFQSRTFQQVEWKLTVPLVASESVKMYYRTQINGSYTQLTDIETAIAAGQISNAYKVNFEKIQWLQLRCVTSSTSSTPSYVRLREFRIR